MVVGYNSTKQGSHEEGKMNSKNRRLGAYNKCPRAVLQKVEGNTNFRIGRQKSLRSTEVLHQTTLDPKTFAPKRRITPHPARINKVR